MCGACLIDRKYDVLRNAYDKNNVKYSLYQSNDKFNGYPIPEGFEIKLMDEDQFPVGIMLIKQARNVV